MLHAAESDWSDEKKQHQLTVNERQVQIDIPGSCRCRAIAPRCRIIVIACAAAIVVSTLKPERKYNQHKYESQLPTGVHNSGCKPKIYIFQECNWSKQHKVKPTTYPDDGS